jgi:hypothetical protein
MPYRCGSLHQLIHHLSVFVIAVVQHAMGSFTDDAPGQVFVTRTVPVDNQDRRICEAGQSKGGEGMAEMVGNLVISSW